MNNNVTVMACGVDDAAITRLFNRFKARYDFAWSSICKTPDEWVFRHEEWLEELSCFSLEHFRQAVNEALAIYDEFPPKLPQLIKLCLKASGIPCKEDIIALMVNRDFNHPMVKMIFDKIGSWALSSAKAEDIKKQVNERYAYALIEYRDNPPKAWAELNHFKEQKALESPIPDKIPTPSQRISFAERMKQYHAAAAEGVKKLKDQKHPEFPKNAITPGSRDFDQDIYNQYRDYLLSVPETLVLSLTSIQAYDRMRFLTKIEAASNVEYLNRHNRTTDNENVSSRGFNGRSKGFKDWVKD